MAELGDLAQSSPTTRSWLKTLQAALSDFEYDQKRFWASFRSRSPRAVVAYLNPSKNKIRLFLPLEPHLHEDLRAALSSKSWKKRFPSTYDIQDARQLPVAMEFIRWAAARTTAADTNPVDLPVFEVPPPKPMPGEVDTDVHPAPRSVRVQEPVTKYPVRRPTRSLHRTPAAPPFSWNVNLLRAADSGEQQTRCTA